MNIRNIALATILAISPLSGVLAQGTGPGIKADSTQESNAVKDGAAKNPHQPGATGSTVVPGNKSSLAGDHKATAERKAGGTAGGK